VYKSEVVKNDLRPTWKPMKLKVRDLCNGDYNRALKIDIYDWDSNGKHDIIGTIRTNFQEIRY
jgi:Ca2+-dependent lipid-binding protein